MAIYDLTSSIPTKVVAGDILNCPYSGTSKSITLPKGTYKLECWGAQGGSYNSTYYGGKGGYSVGKIIITEPTIVYIYAGGQGIGDTTTGEKAGGFNGGGRSYISGSGYEVGSGGGASDIRIGQDSLYARIIVAGGGGGAGSYSSSYRYSGGAGGGVSGITPSQYNTSYKSGEGGTQTSRGTSHYYTYTDSTTYGTLADFGIGAGATIGKTYRVTGGGGGWYGGGSGGRAAGGGGSGYVYTSSTASSYPSGCLLNSSMYLTDANTIAGNASMPSTSGSTETGHSGNGYVRITVIEAGGSLPLRVKVSGAIKETTAGYVKVNGIWKEISSLYIKVDNVWNLAGCSGSSGGSGGSGSSFDAYGRATVNGNEVVNLGLPSGLLWATCNVGTNTETSTGNYYRYGLGSTTYSSSQSSYTGLENPLSLSYDTARQVMGGDFRMPTNTEMQELIDNTNQSWVTINSVSGMKFTCKTDSNKYVFFPAAGRYASGSLGYTTYAYVISSTPNTTAYSYFLVMNSSSAFVDNGAERDRGFSVRGVISQ